MTDTLRFYLAQLNPTVGDLRGNIALVRAARQRAAAAGADLVITSELVVTGYPPEDLILKPAFLAAVEEMVAAFAAETKDGGPAVLLGTPWREDGKAYNAALLLDGGSIAAKRYKYDLPNYGVFDEKRVFTAGPLPGPVNFRGVRLGVQVCEDMWTPEVTECLGETGSEILVVLNGSPFDIEKQGVREKLARDRVAETGLPLVYVNQVGGQDELVFDGGSFVYNADRTGAAQLVAWDSAEELTTWHRTADGWRCDEATIERPPGRLEAIYAAMVTGLRDYVNKNRFPGVIIGMSGGIDSAITAAVAADALGPDKVRGVAMPSRYTSQASLDDAKECCRLLGVSYEVIAITEPVAAFEATLATAFAGKKPDITEENLQARARGMIAMALSNKFGDMVVTTGNKSEMSVGYATLYGDMCGGFSVLKDVYKTTVYALCNWRNQNHPKGVKVPAGRVIPQAIIDKAPSAELRPDQKDQDSLPPYDALDDMLHGLVEEEKSIREIVARGHDLATVQRIARLLYLAEYKRRQAPPGVKITEKSFGRERRYPIVNAFREIE